MAANSVKRFICGVFLAISCTTTFAQGIVKDGNFFSPALGVEKSYRVYLPAGYEKGDNKYPVIYLLHGWGATEKSWSSPALAIANAANAIKLQAIIVMPDGDRSLYANAVSNVSYDACLNDVAPARNKSEPRSTFCVKTPRYEDYIVQDLITHIDIQYRTIARREARALTGESAGGHGALQIAFRHKDKFSSVANHSGVFALMIEGEFPYAKNKLKIRQTIDPSTAGLQEQIEIYGTDLANWRAHDPFVLIDELKRGEVAIYLDCGRNDEFGFQHAAQYFDDKLNAQGIAHEFALVDGGHNEALWKRQIGKSLKFHAKHFAKNPPTIDF